MLSLIPGALVRYGWNDRVADLYLSHVNLSVPDPAVVREPARVTRVERAACVVVAPDGNEHVLRANDLPAVGDWVVIDRTRGVLEAVLPRGSALTRMSADGATVQVLAANHDLVLVVTPADRSSPARVEREVALAYNSGATPLVVMTKGDLDTGSPASALDRRLLGIDVLVVSVFTGAGLADLSARLAPGLTAVLLGPSGAGKSSLTNVLAGSELLTVGAVRAGDGRGRHTTSSRQLVPLPGGGLLIDTPGLRSLGLPAGVDAEAGFAEVAELARRCRFSDCQHVSEPGCAVRAALESGELDADRWSSFVKLSREIAWQERRHDPLAAQAERRVWAARTRANRRTGPGRR